LIDSELNKLRLTFGFLEQAYRHHPDLAKTKLATDLPQFYTLVTTLLSTDLLSRYPHPELEKRILAVAKIIDETEPTPALWKRAVGDFRAASAKQTTHPSKREKRQQILLRLLNEMDVN